MNLPYWLQPGSQNYIDYMTMVHDPSEVFEMKDCITRFEDEMWNTWRMRHNIWQYLPGMPHSPKENDNKENDNADLL